MRVDFIFSYWIFFWYLLYISGLIVQYNPKFAILCGLAENVFILLLMLYFHTNVKLILLFIIMMIPLKIIPLYTLWDTKITWIDVQITFFVFLFYLVWGYMNDKKIHDFTKRTQELILHNKNTLPGMQILDKIIKKIRIFVN